MGDSSIDIGEIDIIDQPEKKNNDVENANNGFIINKEADNFSLNKNECEEGLACKLSHAEEFWTCKRNNAVKIRMSGEKDSIANLEPISIMEFFKKTVDRFPNRPALKVERDGKWITWTYKEYFEEIRTTSKAFIQLGLEPYNGVGILGFNSPEWLFADVGAIFAGGLAVGIYTTNNSEMCHFNCEDACCNIVVVENNVQLQKILQVWDRLPKLKAIVQYTGELKEKKPNLYTWNELMEIGRGISDSVLEQRINAQSPNKCCTLIYTSGTTGNPKGVMLSHDNITICAITASKYVGLNPDVSQDQAVSYLPLSHIAAQLTDIWIPVFAAACVWFAGPDALKGALIDTLKQARPTLFLGVPRVFEKIEEKLKSIGAATTGVKKTVSSWMKAKLLLGNQLKEAGKPVPYGWTIASKLMKNVHKSLGLDRCRLIFTSAAPISKQTLEYFQSLNLPLLELYGMSESTGPLTVCSPGHSRITSVGKLLPINEAKIGNPDEDGSGELCFRGRNIMMGYLNSEEKTKESLDDDGWLKSGDVGKIDEDGFYYITGRIKELIITAGGENIAPIPIEDNIKLEIPFVSTVMVIGDKKKFLSCIITPHVEIDKETGLSTDKLLPSAVNYCKELGLEVTKSQDISPNVPEVLQKAIQDGIDRANKKAVSNASKVQKWKLLPLEFTTAGGELGPTQKLRRPQVMKMYKETIDEMYENL